MSCMVRLLFFAGVGSRPVAGCFRPFWDAPISQLSDRVVPAARLFGPLAEKTRQAVICAQTSPTVSAQVARQSPRTGMKLRGRTRLRT